MARNIHCVKKDGRFYYREWCTVGDTYTTTPTANVEALKSLIFQRELDEFIENFEKEWPTRIERAQRTGTSSGITDRQLDTWNGE